MCVGWDSRLEIHKEMLERTHSNFACLRVKHYIEPSRLSCGKIQCRFDKNYKRRGSDSIQPTTVCGERSKDARVDHSRSVTTREPKWAIDVSICAVSAGRLDLWKGVEGDQGFAAVDLRS